MAAAPKTTAPRAAPDLAAPRERSRASQRATVLLCSSRRGLAPAVVGAVLRPIAADRHGAPGRRSVLRAVVERVPALATALQARPVTGELRLVEDAEQRGHGTVDAASSGFEGGPPRVVDGDAEPSAAEALRMTSTAAGPDRSPWFAIASVRSASRSSRRRATSTSEIRSPGATSRFSRSHACAPSRSADAVPVGRQVVVVGVDEALQDLEPPGRLGSPSRLDLLAHPSLVVLVHGLARFLD